MYISLPEGIWDLVVLPLTMLSIVVCVWAPSIVTTSHAGPRRN